MIRGGFLSFTNFEVSTYNHYVKSGSSEYALSVFCLPGFDDGDEVARRCAALNNDKYRESRVGLIREAGYDVVRNEPPPGHALIKLPSPPSEEGSREYWRGHWENLKAIFAKAKDNPASE